MRDKVRRCTPPCLAAAHSTCMAASLDTHNMHTISNNNPRKHTTHSATAAHVATSSRVRARSNSYTTLNRSTAAGKTDNTLRALGASVEPCAATMQRQPQKCLRCTSRRDFEKL
jgi:hypothetical protein